MHGIYIHFPFCVHKCSYCDFYSIEELGRNGDFVFAVLKEIELFFTKYGKRPECNSLFLGGGTPSLLTVEQISSIIEKLEVYVDFTADAEMTAECNPGSTLEEKLNGFRDAGINRVSIGVQSFNKNELYFLERIHNEDEAERAIEKACAAGFDNLSLDLIYSIPGQTMQSWQHTLGRAISCNTDHISAYSLIYEKGTPLYKDLLIGKVKAQPEEIDFEMYLYCIEKLTNAGFEHYEVSNYAKPGKYCRHNLDIWHGGRYFAFGPSAHGYTGNIRYWNVRSINRYIKSISESRLPVEGTETIGTKEELNERIYLGLRSDGLDISCMGAKFGFNVEERLGDITGEWIKKGYAFKDNGKIRLTPEGYLLCDELSVIMINKTGDLIKQQAQL